MTKNESTALWERKCLQYAKQMIERVRIIFFSANVTQRLKNTLLIQNFSLFVAIVLIFKAFSFFFKQVDHFYFSIAYNSIGSILQGKAFKVVQKESRNLYKALRKDELERMKIRFKKKFFKDQKTCII